MIKENFELTDVKKTIEYKTKISLPLQLIKLINKLDNEYSFDDNIYEEGSSLTKEIDKKNFTFYFIKQKYNKFTLFPQAPYNKITVIKRKEKINEEDVFEIKKIILYILKIYEAYLNADVQKLLNDIEKINFGSKCLKCKKFSACSEENITDNNCRVYRNLYIQEKKKTTKFNKEWELNRLNKKIYFLKEIEKVKSILNISFEENETLKKEFADEKIDFIIKNEDVKKSKYNYGQYGKIEKGD